jgi:hypothetical protein
MRLPGHDIKRYGYTAKGIRKPKSNKSQAVAEPVCWNGVEPTEKTIPKDWLTNELEAIVPN